MRGLSILRVGNPPNLSALSYAAARASVRRAYSTLAWLSMRAWTSPDEIKSASSFSSTLHQYLVFLVTIALGLYVFIECAV